MKKISLLVATLLVGAFVSPVFADGDDLAWIGKCMIDNQKQGQSDATVKAYCTCMNNKMSSSETKSITAWEKTHKAEEEACGKESGWSGQ